MTDELKNLYHRHELALQVMKDLIEPLKYENIELYDKLSWRIQLQRELLKEIKELVERHWLTGGSN
jgi:hypothetical protein